MSLSYRKARTAPAGSVRRASYRMAGSGKSEQPAAAGTAGFSGPEPAGAAKATQPVPAGSRIISRAETAGTSAMQLEVVPDVPNDEDDDVAGLAVRSGGDNVVELFPGASNSTGTGGRGWMSRLRYAETGMATAEYAITTLAAVGFAGLLVVILRSDEVRGFLMGLIEQALSFG